MNFLQYLSYLHVKLTRVDLGNSDDHMVNNQGGGLSNGVMLGFDSKRVDLVLMMPVRRLTNLLRLPDQRSCAVLKQYLAFMPVQANISSATQIGVYETASLRGHNYASLFVYVEEKKTPYVNKGRDHQALQSKGLTVLPMRFHTGHHLPAYQLTRNSKDQSLLSYSLF